MAERTIAVVEQEMIEEATKPDASDSKLYTLQAERDALLIIELRAERDAAIGERDALIAEKNAST